MIQAGSNSLSEEFDKANFMGAFTFILALVIFFSRLANATILVNWPSLRRSYIVTTMGIVAFVMVAYACHRDDDPNFFWLAIAASVFCGIGSGIGEAAIISYLKGFPSHLVGYVSSGTGFAGISGTFGLLALKAANLSNFTIYLIMAPTLIIF
jgi:hypothetical protein